MAGVCKTYKSDKSWRIFWNADGKQYFRIIPKTEFPKKKNAYQEAVRLEAQGEKPSAQNMSIVDFYENIYKKNRTIEEGSRASYKAMMQRFMPFIELKGIRFVGEVTEELIIQYLNHYRTQIPKGKTAVYSPKTLNRDRDYLNLIFEMAQRKGHLKKWERKEIQSLSEKNHKRMPDYKNYPNRDERTIIAKWILGHEPYYFAWLHFDAVYGWRRDEVRKLMWNDIDFNNKVMKLLSTKVEQRMFRLDDEDIIVLTEHILILKKMNKYDPNGYVFPNIAPKRKEETKPIICKNNLYKAIKRACVALEITKHVTPHTFRHAVSSELGRAGFAPADIIQYTGHKDTDSLKFYTHPDSDLISKMRKVVSLGVMPKVRNNEKTMQ